MPAYATPTAQADAHVCLLDVLGIRHAAVVGGSAGGPSAMQMAIRHPDRVNALVLLVPLAYKPSTVVNSVAPLSSWAENLILRLIGSDFVFWVALYVARDQVIKYVLATPPEQVDTASPQERARVNRVLTSILPVSIRAQGLRSDSVLGKGIARYPLEAIRAPTLVISVRDDGFGTYASAEYTASQIAGAKFFGFDHGGHLWVGHDEEVQASIVKFINPADKR
jgi:pimeloyl-ACP methyl ester carboxylesterase